MSARLRARAAGLLKQLDAGGGYRELIAKEVEKRLAEAPSAPGANDAVRAGQCSACHTQNDADARFCKSCGAKL